MQQKISSLETKFNELERKIDKMEEKEQLPIPAVPTTPAPVPTKEFEVLTIEANPQKVVEKQFLQELDDPESVITKIIEVGHP